MKSMTGFGTARAAVGDDEVRVELRAVNHRFLDIRVRASGPLKDHGSAAEQLLRAKLERGRVEALLRFEQSTAGGHGAAQLDLEAARAAYRSLVQLRDELQPGAEVPLQLLACVPQLFRSEVELDHELIAAAVKSATREACTDLDRMRSQEGDALEADLRGHLSQFQELCTAAKARAPKVVAERRNRLRERIQELVTDAAVTLDEGRVEHEIAIFSEKVDIAEELSRLDAHLNAMDSLLGERGTAIGRKLDFLLQEVGRETNTVGSKSPDAPMTAIIIDLKACLERMREQVQNVL
jgi:uncharacterized protein (TIGR00255 family)